MKPLLNAGQRLVAALTIVVGLAGSVTTVRPADAAEPTPQGSSFRDDFNRLNSKRWMVSDGWVNGRHQNCTWSAERVKVMDGILRLELKDDPAIGKAYGCAEIQSYRRYGYGVIEARLKVTPTSGVNSAFFSHVGAPQKKPHNEIDFEFIGRDGGMLQTNYFTNNVGKHERLHPVVEREAFHNYAFAWEPDRLRWYIDGVLIREERGTPMPATGQKLYLSIWSSDTMAFWLGAFVHAAQPVTLDVDWISYTNASDRCPGDVMRTCPSPAVATE